MNTGETNRKLHVAYIVHTFSKTKSADDMLDVHFTTTDWVAALTSIGIRVTVFYRFFQDEIVVRNGTRYYFIKDNLPECVRSFHRAKRFHKRIGEIMAEIDIDVIHTHNPFSSCALRDLRRVCPNIPIVVQDHAGKKKLSKKALLRWGLSAVDMVIFNSSGQETPWVKNDILDKKKIQFVLENSSTFDLLPRSVAQQRTKMTGNPVFLFVGNFTKNKRPFVVLNAFEAYVRNHPEARLYIINRISEGQQDVINYIAQNQQLKQRVTMLGSQKRVDMMWYYNSAHFIVSGSEKEGSGYSVIEAMSCGVVPILTEIPSFVDITSSGKVGGLYPVDDVDALAKLMADFTQQDWDSASRDVLTHFDSNLSFDAIAKKMHVIYTNLIDDK